MSREMIKGLIELVPEKDMEVLYKVILKFIPEVPPEADELKAFAEAEADLSPTIPHEAVNWE